MSDVIGKHGGIEIKVYDVCQVSDDGGQTWPDYATIRDATDLYYASLLVEGGGGFNGHRKAMYRIARGSFNCIVPSGTKAGN